LLLALGCSEVEGSSLPSATATQIAMGRLFSCALTTEGSVRCWGTGRDGVLGDGRDLGDSSIREQTPAVQVVGLTSGVVMIASGPGSDHACALTDAGTVSCWGANHFGQLGDGTEDPSSVPVSVLGLAPGTTAISVGEAYSCALIAGAVTCWGDVASGDVFATFTEPTIVPGLESGVAAVSAGAEHLCARMEDGTVRCYGSNSNGEGGTGDNAYNEVATEVPGLAGVVELSAGVKHTCAIVESGAAYCWGLNENGQIGNGTGGDSVFDIVTTPAGVTGLGSGVTAIAAGSGSSIAAHDGTLQRWGLTLERDTGEFQALAPGTIARAPNDIAALGAGALHACLLTGAGAVHCWGDDQGGQLGRPWNADVNDGFHYSDTPLPVDSLP
jgi:alpha-tubulin suppressor-like RCC1 family protein